MSISELVADFIAANPSHTGGSNGEVDLITVHGTVSACVAGGARGNAHYFQNPAAGGAAHYAIDPAEIIGCVDEDTVAHHAPPNTGSIGLELCDWQGFRNEGDLWGDQPHNQMLSRAAPLVRDIAKRHPKVKLEWRTTADLVAGRRGGITGHLNVAQAYHRSDHRDPGQYFPNDRFMALVTGAQTPEAPVAEQQETTFIAEFLDQPGTLWLVKVEPQTRQGGLDGDPSGRYGTRTRVVSPEWLWILAEAGVPVRSGQIKGMGLYREVK